MNGIAHEKANADYVRMKLLTHVCGLPTLPMTGGERRIDMKIKRYAQDHRRQKPQEGNA